MARLKDTEINGNLVVKGDLLNKDGVDLTTAFSNPNLLINGDFQVWQRGENFALTTGKTYYTADRWRTYLLSVEKGENHTMILTSGANTGSVFNVFENYTKNDTYTLSVKVKNVTGTCKAYVEGYNGVQLTVGLNIVTFNNASHNGVVIQVLPNSSVEIEWVKLEQGSIATPFVPRHYGEELALCQRYYQVVTTLYAMTAWIGYSAAILSVPLAVPLRAKPSVTCNTMTFKYQHDGAANQSITLTNVTAPKIDGRGVELNFLAAFNLNAFKAARLHESTYEVYLDAEIY